MKKIQEEMRNRGIDMIFFCILLGGYLAMTLVLFHRQSVSYGGRYISDMPPYVAEIDGISSGYDFAYPVMFWMGRLLTVFTSAKHATAMVVTALNGLNVILLKLIFDRLLGVKSNREGIFNSVLVFMLLFAGMLYPCTWFGQYREIGDGFLYRYRGTFSPNPLHNATYLAARPFATAAFFLAADILRDYEEREERFHPKYVLFAVTLLLATLTKPSFTLVLVCTCGCIMLYRLVRGKMRGIKAFLQFGITFIPTFLALIWQYGQTFVGEAAGTEKGIGFAFLTAWKTASSNVPLSVLLGMAFPGVVLIFQKGKFWEKSRFSLAWEFYLVAILMFLFLYEKGYRMAHMNFAWGYMYGMYFTYIVSAAVLVQETKQRKQSLWMLILQWGLFGIHVACGFDYFLVVFGGGLYL